MNTSLFAQGANTIVVACGDHRIQWLRTERKTAGRAFCKLLPYIYRVRSLACRTVSSAMSVITTVFMEIMIGKLPLILHLVGAALMCGSRLVGSNRWLGNTNRLRPRVRKYGHIGAEASKKEKRQGRQQRWNQWKGTSNVTQTALAASRLLGADTPCSSGITRWPRSPLWALMYSRRR